MVQWRFLFLPQMLMILNDIRIPNHAMIKKYSVMVAVCLGKEQLNPRIYRG